MRPIQIIACLDLIVIKEGFNSFRLRGKVLALVCLGGLKNFKLCHSGLSMKLRKNSNSVYIQWTRGLDWLSLLRMKVKGIAYKSELGKYLRETRKEAGLSQEAFADKIGINRTYYGNLERGENSISIDKLQKISRALNIPLSELFLQVEKL